MKIETLGKQLRAARKRHYPKDTLEAFAVRIEVGRATLQKMEQGDLSVTLQKYYQAAEVLGMTSNLERLFFEEKSLFDD